MKTHPDQLNSAVCADAKAGKPAKPRARKKTTSTGRTRRCQQRDYGALRTEAEEQTLRVARQIMQANVAKAKEGSLAHSKWLFSIIETSLAEKTVKRSARDGGLAKRLLRELECSPPEK